MEYTGEERRHYPDGHNTPCPMLTEHKALETQLHSDLQELLVGQEKMIANQETILEIVTAWNNTKGFVKTLVMISTVLKWLVFVCATVAGIWYALVEHK